MSVSDKFFIYNYFSLQENEKQTLKSHWLQLHKTVRRLDRDRRILKSARKKPWIFFAPALRIPLFLRSKKINALLICRVSTNSAAPESLIRLYHKFKWLNLRFVANLIMAEI